MSEVVCGSVGGVVMNGCDRMKGVNFGLISTYNRWLNSLGSACKVGVM